MKVIVCKEVVDGLRAITFHPWEQYEVVERREGFEVELDGPIVAVIHAVQQEGESFDDVLLRLMAVAKAKGKAH